MVSQKIGRYEISSQLGRGGMATVYHAYDPRFKRNVAIKIMPREFMHDPTFFARFEREAQTIAGLEHSCIAPVYDFGEHEGQPYLVMRYMSGGSLSNRIGEGPLQLDEAVAIMARIGSALDSAHQQSVIHRDVKPANILFDKYGDAFLSDFGIVKVAESTAQLTGSGVVGTPAYMAPEISREGGLTHLIDVYALGVTLFETLTGTHPYRADTPLGVMMAHHVTPVPSLLEYRSDLADDLQDVIEMAMAKDPLDRYQSAGELAAGFKAAVTAAGVSGPAPAVTAAGEEVPAVTLPAAPAPATAEVTADMPSPAETLREEPQPLVVGEEEEEIYPEEIEPTLVEAGAAEEFPPAETLLAQPEPVSPAMADTLEEEYYPEEPEPAPAEIAALEEPVAVPARRGLPVWVWAGGAVVAVAVLVGVLSLLGVFEGGAAEEEVEPTDIPASTEVPIPLGYPGNPVISNSQWTPVLQDFDGVPMALVPAGCFMMGSKSGGSDEQPVHEVCFEAPFWIDVYEVTNGQYGSSGTFSGDDLPRDTIDWFDASAHCATRGGWLPTEAQWEYAARGPDGLLYPWGNEFDCHLGNYDDETDYDGETVEGGAGCDGFVTTSHVGSFPEGASWVGALDMGGNVWEWVADWYDQDYYKSTPRDNPQGPDSGEYRVLRGGSWDYSDIDTLRAAFRDRAFPTIENIRYGFRCVLSGEFAVVRPEPVTPEPEEEAGLPEAPPFVEGEILFDDDFEQGNIMDWSLNDYWTIAGSADGHFLQGVGNPAVISGGDVNWTDYALEFRFYIVGFEEDFLQQIGASVRTDFDRDRTGCESYLVKLSPIPNDQNNQTRNVLDLWGCAPKGLPLSVSIGSEAWYRVRIEAFGTTITVYVDDRKVASMEDDHIANGYFTFRVHNGTTAYFDDVRVIELRAP